MAAVGDGHGRGVLGDAPGEVVVADDAPRVVVLRALGLGDLLTAVPALRGLRASFPGHRIVLAAPAALAPLAAMTGAVDETVDTAPLAPLDPSLHRADVAVNLHGRGPQTHAVLRDTHPRRTIAFADGAWSSGPRWREREHEVVRWCRLLATAGVLADPRDLRIDPPDHGTASATGGIPTDGPTADGRTSDPSDAAGAVIVHPGAASAARRWPAERFAAVARTLADRGERVLVTGGPDERELADEVTAGAGLPPEASIAGRTDLPALATVVARAGGVVCGDTGVAHLATAFGRPSVLLFGPTPPELWGPIAATTRRGPRHAVLWDGTTGDPHADEPHPGLLHTTPDAVLRALEAVRAVGPAPARATGVAVRRATAGRQA